MRIKLWETLCLQIAIFFIWFYAFDSIFLSWNYIYSWNFTIIMINFFYKFLIYHLAVFVLASLFRDSANFLFSLTTCLTLKISLRATTVFCSQILLGVVERKFFPFDTFTWYYSIVTLCVRCPVMVDHKIKVVLVEHNWINIFIFICTYYC